MQQINWFCYHKIDYTTDKMIPESVFNRLFYDKGEIAAEVKATLPGCRRWIAISPAQNAHPLAAVDQTIPKHVYSVLDFELKEELIDEYFGEEDKLNQRRYFLSSLSELNALLSTLNVDLAKFTFPWRCDYPL